MMVRVLIAEEHRLVRETLVRLLDAQGDVEVVADTGRGDRALELIAALHPDVAILDAELPGLDPRQVCAELRRRGTPAGAISLTTRVDAVTLHRSIAAGVGGHVAKGDSVEELLAAIRAVAHGSRYLSPSVQAAVDAPASTDTIASSLLQLLDAGSYAELMRALERVPHPQLEATSAGREVLMRELGRRQERAAADLEPFGALTPRERDVLAELVVGKSADEIASEHVLSLATVRTHIRGVLQKLDVKSQVAAVALAWQLGWAADALAEGPSSVATAS